MGHSRRVHLICGLTTVTNRQLEMMLRQYLPRKGTTLRIPVL